MTIHQEVPTNLGDLLQVRSETAHTVDISINFLKWLDPNGWHNLVAINPKNGVATGRTFAPSQWTEMVAWISTHSGSHNCYYSLNEPKPGSPNKKLATVDIGSIRAIGIDVDPEDGVDLEDARAHLKSKMEQARTGEAPASIVIDSGGGVQAFWKLNAKVPREEHEQWAKDQGRALHARFGGDAVHSIEHLFRLPGPLNIPDAKKLARGRIKRQASIMFETPQLYAPETLSAFIPPVEARAKDNGPDSDALVRQAMDEIDIREVQGAYALEDLPTELQYRFGSACQANPKLAALWDGDKSALLGNDATGSGWRGSLAKLLARDRNTFDAMDYAQLSYVWPQAAGLLELDEPELHRQLARDWGRMGAPETREVLVARWFEEYLEPQPGIFPDEHKSNRSDLFEFLTINDIANRPDPKYLVDRHIPEGSLGFIYARSGAGKSFLALDMALSIAFDLPRWQGDLIQAPSGASVVYIAGEGVSGLKARIAAWKHHHGIPPSQEGRFQLLPQAVNMMQLEQVEKLARSIRQRINGPVAAIFIDTVSRAIPGADENLQKEMSKFIEACDTVKRGANCAVVGIHHTNKAGDMRGSGVLDAGLDFIFKLTRANGASIGKLSCEKMKDGPDGWHTNYIFEQVTDADGQSSLVPTRVGDGDIAGGNLTPDKTKAVFRALQDAWDAGEPWSRASNAKRRAIQNMVPFGFTSDSANEALEMWEGSGIIITDKLSDRQKTRGLRLTNLALLEEGSNASAFD